MVMLTVMAGTVVTPAAAGREEGVQREDAVALGGAGTGRTRRTVREFEIGFIMATSARGLSVCCRQPCVLVVMLAVARARVVSGAGRACVCVRVCLLCARATATSVDRSRTYK